MSISVKKAFGIALITVCVALPGFGQTPTIEDLQTGAEDMAKTLSAVLPFNSTLGLNWSDAYIGQLLGVPPHFGVGVSAGATTVQSDEIKVLLDTIGVDTEDFPEVLPIPAAAAEARIGGFFLPFDIGVKAGYIPSSLGSTIQDATGGLNMDYLSAGADLRFALITGNILLPRVSLGVGVNYMKGGLSTTISEEQSFTFNDGEDHIIAASEPELGLSWETTTVDLKAQVSKGILIFTPYAGLGASYGMSKAGYFVKSDIKYDGHTITDGELQTIKDTLSDNGITPPDISATEISSYFENNSWAFRAFGGLSLNIVVVRVDLTGLYNFSDASYGGSVGVRFQL